MDLIYYRGLNCHLTCLISIANFLGVSYLDAYSTLWSETDFTDEEKYNIYVSKRVFINLEAIGVRTRVLELGGVKTAESMSGLSVGEFVIIGMDIFDIPWHPVFRNFHDPHFFFAQKETAHSLLCYDPVYNEKATSISTRDIFSSVFELFHVYKVDAAPLGNDITQEAEAVLRCHPEAEKKLLAEIAKCKKAGHSSVSLLIKQITAMINNRYLFGNFFHNTAWVSGRLEHFFDESYFLKWEAVRNGLYKALIMKDSESVIDEVYDLFANLMREEEAMAKEIITVGAIVGKQLLI